MNVKEAVQKAKAYIADIFAEEGVVKIGLEEVEFDHHSGTWLVTIGFSRVWPTDSTLVAAIMSGQRAYKVVKIDDGDGTVLAMKDRTPQAA
jgi:hypothetical protein